jgi:pyrimidine deaminase RibD-like protein
MQRLRDIAINAASKSTSPYYMHGCAISSGKSIVKAFNKTEGFCHAEILAVIKMNRLKGPSG